MIEKFKSEDDGVSPVIGVILLVAVTVALVALATVIVFDIGSDVSETADATVQLNQVSGGIQATIVRNENVQDFTLSGPINSDMESNTVYQKGSTTEYDYPTDGTVSNVGETVVYPNVVYNTDSSGTQDSGTEVASLSDGATVSVIATLEDGTEEVLTSTDYEA